MRVAHFSFVDIFTSIITYGTFKRLLRIQISLGVVHVLFKAMIKVWLQQGQGTAGMKPSSLPPS